MAPNRPNINEIHMAIALLRLNESHSFDNRFDKFGKKTVTYFKAVGYVSTATAFNTFRARLQSICVTNADTCITCKSVIMHVMPARPVTVRIMTVNKRISIKRTSMVIYLKNIAWINSHMIGNFPTFLISKAVTNEPMAKEISQITDCSSVANSNLVTQAC